MTGFGCCLQTALFPSQRVGGRFCFVLCVLVCVCVCVCLVDVFGTLYLLLGCPSAGGLVLASGMQVAL